MHKSLTESLHLGRSRIRSCHLCEIGIHAGIPTAETQNVPVCFKVADIETLTGRADEGAGPATDARAVELLPLFRIEDRELFSREVIGFEVRERKLLHYCFYLGLDRVGGVLITLCEQIFECV